MHISMQMLISAQINGQSRISSFVIDLNNTQNER